jgi:NAD+ kinase
MAVIALVPHRLRAEAADLASAAARWLAERGHEARVPSADAEGVTGAAVVPDDDLGGGNLGGVDLVVALGGDGTVLHAVQLVCGTGVPVLGVNVGHLGYLTVLEPAGMLDGLERFLAGGYQVEDRMMLDIAVACGSAEDIRATALNEAVLEKTASGHTIQVAIRINDRPFTTAAADGMIVATPTGSTAYNFSARGPIVSPLHRALVLTPVAPHMLFDRSLVLGAEEVVEVEVLEGRPAILVVDGRELATLAPGDRLTCQAAKHDARFVTFGAADNDGGGRDFHQILKAKFKLADR